VKIKRNIKKEKIKKAENIYKKYEIIRQRIRTGKPEA
jgi:hypothetical protein